MFNLIKELLSSTLSNLKKKYKLQKAELLCLLNKKVTFSFNTSAQTFYYVRLVMDNPKLIKRSLNKFLSGSDGFYSKSEILITFTLEQQAPQKQPQKQHLSV